MKIILNDQQNKFEQKLRNNINALVNPMFLDITIDRESQQVLTLSDNDKYTLSYSRPFFMNIFKPPLASYEFVFSLKRNPLTEGKVIITGKVKMKKYMIGALIFVGLTLLYTNYNIIYHSLPFDYFFLIVMPLILFLYLLIEWFFFRRKVMNFIKGLSDEDGTV